MKLAVVIAFLGIAGAFASPIDTQDRIVGGQNAFIGQFPYQISMQSNGQHFCGGSIISPTKILTAAHCIYGSNKVIDVVAGIDNLTTRGQRVRVARSIYHQDYVPSSITNDIAVLILSTPLTFNTNVQPIKLATTNPAAGEILTLSGWGLTSYPNGQIPAQLQTIKLRAIDTQTCANQLAGVVPLPITTGNVCTASPAGQGACQGDSGGPLIFKGVQVGVVSWGVPCAKGRPDVFTSVAAYYAWIQNIT